MENISATIDFKLFAFQIRASNAVVVSFVHIIFHMAPLNSFLTSISTSAAVANHSDT